MKTFQQFCEDAYQLTEVAATATSQNPLAKIQRSVSSAIKPVTSNPIVRGATRALGGALNIGFNRVLGAEKLTTDSPRVGPIERGLGGISAASMFAPGVSQTAGFAHNVIGSSPTLQKVDRKIGKEHEKAYKANPQAYTQMLGRSF
jgi:hypothetical protein